MGATDTLERLLALPVVETVEYYCRDCGSRAAEEDDACPQCEGELEETKTVHPLTGEIY